MTLRYKTAMPTGETTYFLVRKRLIKLPLRRKVYESGLKGLIGYVHRLKNFESRRKKGFWFTVVEFPELIREKRKPPGGTTGGFLRIFLIP